MYTYILQNQPHILNELHKIGLWFTWLLKYQIFSLKWDNDYFIVVQTHTVNLVKYFHKNTKTHVYKNDYPTRRILWIISQKECQQANSSNWYPRQTGFVGAALKCAPIMEWEFILASGRSSF